MGNEAVFTLWLFTLGFFCYIMWPLIWPDADGKYIQLTFRELFPRDKED